MWSAMATQPLGKMVIVDKQFVNVTHSSSSFLKNEKLVLKIFMTQALFFLLNLFLSRRLIAKNNNNNLKSIIKQRGTRRQNLHGKAFTLHPMQSTQDHPASSSHIFQTRLIEFPMFVISPANCWPGSFEHLSDLGRGGSDN